MYISKFRVENYKSFSDSGEIEFKSGINIIVGQNNSGKTALLEVLSNKYEQITHKSEKMRPNASAQKLNDEVFQHFQIEISGNEINRILQESRFDYFLMDSSLKEYNIMREGKKDISKINMSLWLDNKKPYLFLFDFYTKELPDSEDKFIYRRDVDGNYFVISKEDFTLYYSNRSPQFTLAEKLSQYTLENIYMLKSERMSIYICPFGTSRELKNNAENLGEVLHSVKTNNSYLFQQYLNLVKEVIPSVQDISIPLEVVSEIGTLCFKIKLWTSDPHLQMEDLMIPLSQCGTGISQVLSILYVVLINKDRPKIIIIDEPNSFLHPSATQKLIQIFNRFPQHQYFISTHSPEVVTASNPSTITMLDYVDGETKVEQIDLSNTNGIKKVFVDLGIKPSTFAFANHILWVEGPTEVKAFSKILENEGIYDVVIKPTVPSEFRQSKKRFGNIRHIFNLHEEISGTNSVISPKMTILLDKESGKDQENADLIKEFGKDKFNFIPRAMYENYLLDPEALAYILNFTKETDDFNEKALELETSDKEINVENIEDFIKEKKESKELLPTELQKENLDETEWLKNIDGAKLLDTLFKHFLGKPFSYSPHKVEYGEKLTQWLLENKAEQLLEIKEFLVNLLAEKNFS